MREQSESSNCTLVSLLVFSNWVVRARLVDDWGVTESLELFKHDLKVS